MGDDPSFIRITRENAVATVTMERPPANAIEPAFVNQIAEAFTELGGDDSVRAVILRSAIPRYFSVGADLKMMAAAAPQGSAAWDSARGEARESAGSARAAGRGESPLIENLAFRFAAIERVPKPVIAAIQGHALGGGCEMALCCDYRYMVDDGRSTIGLTETSLGLIPGAGGTQRLPRLVGKARAMQLIFEATRLKAPDALAIGLVDAAVGPDAFDAAVEEKVQQLAAMATRALGAAKVALLEGLDTSVEEGLRREQKGFLEVLTSTDLAEGVGAFLEKRPPRFTGR